MNETTQTGASQDVEGLKQLAQLCQPFPQHQITHRNIQGREESWVAQHHLFERLNKVMGFDWDWKIVSIDCESVKVGNKEGQRASCLGRLTLRFASGRVVTRDGVGDKDMPGFDAARKSACSVAFRHACKFFTTWLWNGGEQTSLPSALERLGVSRDELSLEPRDIIASKGKRLVEAGVLSGEDIKFMVSHASGGRTEDFRELNHEEALGVASLLTDEGKNLEADHG